MTYNQLKWLILLIPTLTVGIWEYVRHEYLLPYISMDLGNWLTPVIVLFVTFTLLTRLFAKIELMQEQLQQERTEKVALEERERIARELHDGMAQSLFLLSVKIRQLGKLKVSEEDQEKLKEIQASVIDIHDYVRTGIENLRQPVVDEVDFVQKIKDEIHSFQSETNLDVKTVINIDEQILTIQEKRELIFCIKEALINVRKHAKASEVTMKAQISESQKEIEIKDNGVGFQIEKPLVGHFGIRMMQERCERINWSFSIERKKEKTIVSFSANRKEQ